MAKIRKFTKLTRARLKAKRGIRKAAKKVSGSKYGRKAKASVNKMRYNKEAGIRHLAGLIAHGTVGATAAAVTAPRGKRKRATAQGAFAGYLVGAPSGVAVGLYHRAKGPVKKKKKRRKR